MNSILSAVEAQNARIDQLTDAITASAIDGVKALAVANQEIGSQVGGAVQRTEERVQRAVEQIAGEAEQFVTASLEASNERSPRKLRGWLVSSGRPPPGS